MGGQRNPSESGDIASLKHWNLETRLADLCIIPEAWSVKLNRLRDRWLLLRNADRLTFIRLQCSRKAGINKVMMNGE